MSEINKSGTFRKSRTEGGTGGGFREGGSGGGRGHRDDRDFEGHDMDGGDKDRKVFARKRSCWFCEKKTDPDWKNPASYGWLVSEFGKISAARISGICAGHQRSANRAIKRARSIGLISYVSSYTAH